jgi:hypothetical protein
MRVDEIDILKKHGKVISNVLVVLLVLGAIYTKVQDNGVDSLFRSTDLYILLGAMVGLVVIRMYSRKHDK